MFSHGHAIYGLTPYRRLEMNTEIGYQSTNSLICMEKPLNLNTHKKDPLLNSGKNMQSQIVGKT